MINDSKLDPLNTEYHVHFLSCHSFLLAMDLNYLIPERSIPFEEALLKDPDNESLWLDYVQANDGDLERLEFILERAVSALPASHSLWNSYLLLPWTEEHLDKLQQLYRRALHSLRDTPALWLRYVELMKDKDVDEYTQALDSALFNLDHSHHKTIWQNYIQLAKAERGSLGASVYARLFEMQDYEICPFVIDRCECVLNIAQMGDISTAFDLIHQIPRSSIKSAERESFFMSIFLDILVSSRSCCNGAQFERLAIDAALDIPEKGSKFLLKIAQFYEKKSDMPRARHFFNRSMELAISLKNVADSFEKYTDFLENELKELTRLGKFEEVDLRLELFQHVIDNQPILSNDILLKLEPNNIDLWLDRVQIFKSKGKTNEVISTLISAIKGINPLEAMSRNENSLASIWSEYASLYTDLGDNKTANLIYSRAVKSQYKNPDELASIYIMWCELALLNSDEEALDLIEQILLASPNNAKDIVYNNRMLSVQERVFKSTLLWAFYIDLLHSMGDDEIYKLKIRDAYEKMIDLRIVTLRMLFQYVDVLIERGKLQECYSVYEKAIHSFETPTPQFQIWNAYLNLLVKNEQDSDKVVDAFDRCIHSNLPGHFAASIFMLYSDYVKAKVSLTRSVNIQLEAIEFLTRAYEMSTGENTPKIVEDKFELYKDIFTVTRSQLKDAESARRIISSAIKDTQLSLPMVIALTRTFAEYELSLGEILRVRALYKHAASLAHPDSNLVSVIWQEWAQFEVNNGTESTYTDMIKFKRLVTKEFEAIRDYKSEINPMGFVKAENTVKPTELTVSKDPNEIDLDMDM